MADVLNRTTKEYRRSVNTPDYPAGTWIINPNLSAVVGVDRKYWQINGDSVSEMSQAEKDAVDAAEEAARITDLKQRLKDRFNQIDDNTKALGLLIFDMYHLVRDNTPGNTLPNLTASQLRTRFNNIVDSL